MKNKTLMKTLSAFLAVVMVICSAPLSGFVGLELPDWLDFSKIFGVEAEALTSGIYTYEISNGEVTITDCDTSASGAISIPSTIGGYPVTSIGDYAFYECYSLTSVTIPDSVTSMGDFAFRGCESLASVTIGNGVKSIGYQAFAWCESLTSVTMGDSVEVIGDYAFYSCGSLTSVTIPDSVESIGNRAFCGCYSLTSVTIPDSVTSVGDCAFYVCNALTDVYYMGTEEDWNKITIESYNEGLLNATIHFLGEEEHSHSYTSEVTKPSTCSEEGVITYTCSCGDVYEEFIPALAHTWGEWLIAKEPTAKKDGLKVRMCTICADAVDRAVIPLTNNITILLLDSDGKIIREKLIDGDLKEYTFEGIEDGEYTVTVSKANYVTREYDVVSSDGEVTVEFKLNLLGDIDGNGKVNISDYNAILRHVKKTSALDGYAFDCADIDGNGKIMVTDYNAVLRHVKKTEMLW